MSIRAVLSLVAPLAFATYALIVHAEEVKPGSEDSATGKTYQTYLGRQADSGGATEAKPKPKSSGDGSGHVKPFDGASGADAARPPPAGWDLKTAKAGMAPNTNPDKQTLANPEGKDEEAGLLLPAVQKVRESAARSK